MLLIAIAMALTGQATDAQPAAPPPVVARSADGFRIGVDTAATVTAKLGRPNATYHLSDGTVTMAYVKIRSHVKGSSFVPVVGLFAGGASARYATKTFIFGPDGLLKSFSDGEATAECSTLGNCK